MMSAQKINCLAVELKALLPPSPMIPQIGISCRYHRANHDFASGAVVSAKMPAPIRRVPACASHIAMPGQAMFWLSMKASMKIVQQRFFPKNFRASRQFDGASSAISEQQRLDRENMHAFDSSQIAATLMNP